MEKMYIKPHVYITSVETEHFLATSPNHDSASIGGEGSPNEQNQGEISVGGPGVSGAKWNGFDENDR